MYEATKVSSLLFGGLWRECQKNDCDGRCLYGRAFGQGFDSPQVHTCKTAENEMIQRFLNMMSQNEERAFCSLLIYHILCI